MPDAAVSPAVRAVLDVPLHRALGVRLRDPSAPAAGLEVDLGELMTNNLGVLHGGLVPTLLDVASYLAVVEGLEPGTNAVTVSTSTALLTGARAGATLHFAGRLERRGRSLVFLTATVHDGDRLVGTGQVTKAIVAVPG